MAELRRELNLFTATLYGVGIILGAGIYVLLGQGAGIAGNAIWLSFIVAAIIAAFTGLSYAELAGMFPKTAAEYVYTKKAFGKESLSFIVQWIMIFTLIVSATVVALGFGGYFSYITGFDGTLSAAGLLMGLSAISYYGMRESAKFNVIATLVELSGLVIVVILGITVFGSSEVDIFLSPDGIAGILSATTLIFFAYIGFEELVNLSEDTKNARKIIPKALVIALGLSTLLYILVSISAVGILGYEALSDSTAPMTEVVSSVLPQMSPVMSMIALFATANTVLVILIVASRMLYGLAKNGAFPAIFSRIGKRRTPYFSVLAVMGLSVGLLLLGSLKTIALLTDIGIFIVYVFVNASLIWLRFKAPKANRSFRSPINIGNFPVLAGLGIVSSFFMLAHFEFELVLYELVVVATGMAFYVTFRWSKVMDEGYAKFFRKSAFTTSSLAETVVKYPKRLDEIMVRHVRTVESSEKAKSAAVLMKRNSTGSVIVTKNARPVGIITESDFVRKVVEPGKSAARITCREIMSSPLYWARPSDSIVSAIRFMARKKIKRLAVGSGARLEGIVTATNIMGSGATLSSKDVSSLRKMLS